MEKGRLTLTVSERGAEMQSLRFGGRELLWQGDPRFWPDRAPNLFPYIARLTKNSYTYQGKPYRMEIHGFAKDSRFVAARGETLVFSLRSSRETLRQYPFPFLLQVTYRLEEASVHIGYRVENTGPETMFFGIGGHPGFAVPLEDGLRFEDHLLDFADLPTPKRVLFSGELFVTGKEPFALENGRELPLCHALFDDDAIVLADAGSRVTLRSRAGARSVTVCFSGFRYLGLWHRPRTAAPYLCIEPWSSLPSRQGVVEELTEQPDLIALPTREVFEIGWEIRID